MIWVIGDIHGMFDPLNSILNTISMIESPGSPVEKIIFIGDYIDHGPSSKEVIDLILSLKYKTVLLAGNHEDLALRFINQDTRYLKNFGNQWFPNGGVDTYESILTLDENREMLKDLQRCRDSQYENRGLLTYADYEGLELPPKYEKFLKRLKYSHREIFDYKGKKLGFSFFHGLPRWDQPLSQQRIKDHQAFNVYHSRKGSYERILHNASSQFNDKLTTFKPNLSYEDSFIWGRDYSFRWGYGPDVVVHGHIPTPIYNDHFMDKIENRMVTQCASQFEQFYPKLGLPFFFSRTPESGFVYNDYSQADIEENINRNFEYRYCCGKNGAVEAINIDTGAVYGNALTALGISRKGIENDEFIIITAFTGINHRYKNPPKIRTIKVSQLGAGKSQRPKAGLKWATPRITKTDETKSESGD